VRSVEGDAAPLTNARLSEMRPSLDASRSVARSPVNLAISWRVRIAHRRAQKKVKEMKMEHSPTRSNPPAQPCHPGFFSGR